MKRSVSALEIFDWIETSIIDIDHWQMNAIGPGYLSDYYYY